VVHESVCGRFCCKSLFSLAIKNSFGRRRDFRIKMWGTLSPEDKLTGDLGNVIEATSIGGSSVVFFYSRKISAGQFGTFATISARSVSAASSRLWLLARVLRTKTCQARGEHRRVRSRSFRRPHQDGCSEMERYHQGCQDQAGINFANVTGAVSALKRGGFWPA
jgi:hypothetical protein